MDAADKERTAKPKKGRTLFKLRALVPMAEPLQPWLFHQGEFAAVQASNPKGDTSMNPEIEFLVKLRDALLMAADATNDYLDSLAPKAAKDEKKPAAVVEETFLILKFDPMQGAKLGAYEIAYQPNNLEDKWRPAYTILRNANATIKDRYHGDGYAYSYWLYGEGKIYRQKLTPKQQGA